TRDVDDFKTIHQTAILTGTGDGVKEPANVSQLDFGEVSFRFRLTLANRREGASSCRSMSEGMFPFSQRNDPLTIAVTGSDRVGAGGLEPVTPGCRNQLE